MGWHSKGSSDSALPRTAERMVLWLGGAILIGGVQVAVAVAGKEPSLAQRAGLILCLCGAIAVAAVVAARSSREGSVIDLQERARPGRHEVSGADEGGPQAYVEGMERWAEAMLELTLHGAATAAAMESEVAGELTSACEDTRELRDLLHASGHAPLKVSGMATLRSICTMWEADQPRIEQIAADVDPDWHRRWRARSVTERLLRRGIREPEATVLPYRF